MVFLVDSISRHFQNSREQSASTPKGTKKEKRATAKDRRHSVNDGVIVSLSTKKDRRSGRDRRKIS
jgi:hypothetical protein